MKSSIKDAAGFLSVAIWVDGVYSQEQKELLEEIASVLEVDAAELTKLVDGFVASLEEKDEEGIDTFLVEHASALDETDARVLMQCAIEIVMADNVVTRDEVQALLDLAQATGEMEAAEVALMLADLVKFNPEIEVSFE